MKQIEHGSFAISEIEVRDRIRQVDEQWAQGLALLIEQTGLQHPVQLMKVGNSFRLIAGAHRLRAYQLLNRSDIPAFVYEAETDNPELEIRLHEIVENVGRRELSALDRAAHVAELKDTYLKLHGDPRGGDRKSPKSKRQQLPFWSLSDELSEKMGLSERTIRADVELYSSLSAATRKALATTDFADNRSQLVALSKLEADAQKAILKLILGDSPKAGSVAEAIAIHFNEADTKNPDDKDFARFTKLWASASNKARKKMARVMHDWEQGNA